MALSALDRSVPDRGKPRLVIDRIQRCRVRHARQPRHCALVSLFISIERAKNLQGGLVLPLGICRLLEVARRVSSGMAALPTSHRYRLWCASSVAVCSLYRNASWLWKCAASLCRRTPWALRDELCPLELTYHVRVYARSQASSFGYLDRKLAQHWANGGALWPI